MRILGMEIELDAGVVNLLTFCRLNLKRRELVLYRLNTGGKLEMIERTEFLVRNIYYD